jgi:ankyrin repeat protein
MTEAVSFLLEFNADIEKADSYGWRPLHVASEFGQVTMVERLIGAVLILTGNHGMLFLFIWAVMGGNVDIVELLLKHSADVDANTGSFKGTDGRILGPTALHIALDPRAWYPGDEDDEDREDYHEDYLKIARILVEKGASVRGVLDQLQVNDVPSFEGFKDV